MAKHALDGRPSPRTLTLMSLPVNGPRIARDASRRGLHRAWPVAVGLLVFALALAVIVHKITESKAAPVPVICQQFDIFNEQTGQLVPNPSLPQWMRQEAIADGCPA